MPGPPSLRRPRLGPALLSARLPLVPRTRASVSLACGSPGLQARAHGAASSALPRPHLARALLGPYVPAAVSLPLRAHRAVPPDGPAFQAQPSPPFVPC